jgi:iron complex outermembrane receptor protein
MNMPRFSLHPLCLAVAGTLLPLVSVTQALAAIEEMIVTGVRTDVPLLVSTDPRKPRQPLPAHDGADYLKTIPGFSVARKGGTDGDAILRGMAGSRLSMLADGELVLGGCNARMDPPTAYLFPATFDSITVIKGPQTVRYGPGNSAGVVLFERKEARPEQAGWNLHASMLGGRYGRRDEVIDARYAAPMGEVRVSASDAASADYADGDGVKVHSRYARWNAQADLAWTPDEHNRLEFSLARSDGEAAYADREVDGSKFARENYGLRYTRQHWSALVEEADAQVYYNYVDHVMDNYSLRRPAGMMALPSAMNPDRETVGGKLNFILRPATSIELVLGLDAQRNRHTTRSTMNQAMAPYEDLERVSDGEFRQSGLFGELTWDFASDNRVVGGLRVDAWRVRDDRQLVSLDMMAVLPNPTAGHIRKESLPSGFIRYEDALGESGTTLYAGLGHSERFPDYWEILAKEGAGSLTVTDALQAERNTQFDTGLIFKHEAVQASVSAFYSQVADYIMIEANYMKPGMGGMASSRSATIARNIDARTWGLEFDSQYRFAPNWHAELTLASVRGVNDTDGSSLAQLPPLETRLGIHYDNQRWSAGLLWRSLARQDRVDVGRGTIVGQDFGPTAAADVFSLNAGWSPSERTVVSAGIDNLLDETYAEHVSRAGAMIPGFAQIARVNEPGRMLWLKAQYSF